MSKLRIIVERSFDAPQSEADMKRVADRERPCLAAYQATWKRSVLSADRKRMVCEYEADDAETMRRDRLRDLDASVRALIARLEREIDDKPHEE